MRGLLFLFGKEAGILRRTSEKGQAIVEFALVLPVLLLLICGIIDFGWIFGNQLASENAAREAARYTAIHYYDSSTDNDREAAVAIVTGRASTLVSPAVYLAVSGDQVSITVTSQVTVLTPIISAFFPDGEYTATAQCVMRLE